MGDKDTQKKRASEVLHHWLERVLAEFGLSSSHLLASITDSGPDVKRLCTKVLDKVILLIVTATTI